MSDSRPASATFGFDSINRKTIETYSDGAVSEFTYDNVGNRLTQDSSVGTYVSAFDPRNRMTSMQEPGGKTVSYNYDAGGRRTAMGAYGKGTFSYGYDKANRQTLITNASMGP